MSSNLTVPTTDAQQNERPPNKHRVVSSNLTVPTTDAQQNERPPNKHRVVSSNLTVPTTDARSLKFGEDADQVGHVFFGQAVADQTLDAVEVHSSGLGEDLAAPFAEDDHTPPAVVAA